MWHCQGIHRVRFSEEIICFWSKLCFLVAMENWGLITYRESKLLVDSETTQESIDLNLMVVLHEFTVSSLDSCRIT